MPDESMTNPGLYPKYYASPGLNVETPHELWNHIIFALDVSDPNMDMGLPLAFSHIGGGKGFGRLVAMINHARHMSCGLIDYQIRPERADEIMRTVVNYQFELWMAVLREPESLGFLKPGLVFNEEPRATLFISVERINGTVWRERWIIREGLVYSRRSSRGVAEL